MAPYVRGSQTFCFATQKADCVLDCDPQIVIFGLVGHVEWYNIILGKFWRPLFKNNDPKKGRDP